MPHGWIGVDLDGTLAEYSGWTGDPYSIGKPVPKMVERVQQWLRDGKQVWIFTARVSPRPWMPNDQDEIEKIRNMITIWCEIHIGQALPIVYSKNPSMIELWDDRAIQVIPNTGERADGKQ
jgi:hypothetical protein